MAEQVSTLRVTTCMYGGNSRIAFIAGVGFAIAELMVASRRHHGHGAVPGFGWLPDTRDLELPVVELEVIAGASAGGVAGGVLGKMLFHSRDPEDDFARAAELFVEQMDVELFARDIPCPTALFDKTPLTLGGFRAMLDANLPEPEQPALQPDGELWLALTHLSGSLEYFGQGKDDGAGAPVEDLNYLVGRRYDQIDYRALRDELAEAVEATSANPFGFSPQFTCDTTTVGGFACWLDSRARHDPTVPRVEVDLPPEFSAFFDGGALDNRPLGMAIDAMFRRGSGVAPGDRAAVLLVDPDAQTATEAFEAVIDGAEGRRREPYLADQLAGLARGYKILRHERINDDLQRLVTWQARTRMHAHHAFSEATRPGAPALREAADLIVFRGDWRRRAPATLVDTLDLERLAHALASTPHADPARQAVLLGGLRVRRLLLMRERWVEMARRARDDAPARLAIIDRLLEAELAAMNLQTEVLGDADAAELAYLVLEASVGAPLPRSAPVDLALRRVGPPPGGLASSDLGGTMGFFDVDLRAHDLLVGIALGRQAVARLLPAAARARWQSWFCLDDDPRHCDHAVSWFARAEGRLPWARWEAARARIAAQRAEHTPSAPGGIAPATQAYYPALLDTTAHVLERLWVLSALARDRRDNSLYGLNRGPFAVVTRLVVPRLLRLDARVARRTQNARPIRRLSLGLLLLPLLFFVAVGTLSGLVVQAGWQKALLAGLASLFIGGAPLAIVWWIYAIKARRLRAACAPPEPPASDRPAAPRSDGRSP